MIDLSKLTPAPWEAEHQYPQSEDQMYYSVKDEKDNVVFDTLNSDVTVLEFEYEENRRHWFDEVGRTNMLFAALARNAFDVMMRRGWWAVPMAVPFDHSRWCVDSEEDLPWKSKDGIIQEGFVWPDPYTALVEADKWYREHEERE
jgi:hypothetical protein